MGRIGEGVNASSRYRLSGDLRVAGAVGFALSLSK
jgi:hypothetical protein